MEHQNKKSLIPGFPPNGFPAQFAGLQTNGTNALMSTLQTLQMHSMGNGMLPTANLATAEFSQRVLIEQMKAMQSMYNSFGLKAPETASVQNGVATTSGASTSFDRNGSTAKITSANTIFPSATFLSSGDLQNFAASTSTTSGEKRKKSKEENGAKSSSSIDVTSSNAMDAATNQLNNSIFHPKAVHGINLQAMNGFATSMLGTEEWMKSIQLEQLTGKLNEFNRPTHMSSFPSTSNSFPTAGGANDNSNGNDKMDLDIDVVKDSQQDDVEDIFGLSNLDDGVEHAANQTGIFGITSNRGISPVDFTPPDSPDDMSTDLLFGIEPIRANSTPASCSSQPSTSAALNNKEDSMCDGFKVPEVPVSEFVPPTTPPPLVKQPVYGRNIVKSNKVPVYKQKLFTASLEKKEAKKDSKFDEFEFEDDDEDINFKPQDPNDKEIDIFAQCDAKSKNVYVPGIGFAISNDTPSSDLWRHVVPKKRPHGDSKPALPGSGLLPSSAMHEAQIAARLTDGAIVTLAESIRIRRNQRASNKFVTIMLSNDTDCAKNMTKCNKDSNQPTLPKLFIKVSRVFDTLDAPAGTKKKRKKKYTDDDDEDDSDWGDDTVPRRRRKTGKKMYELRVFDPNNAEENHEKCQPTIAFPSNTRSRKNQPDSVEHRLSKFGSAEGFLPKGTYVVCKADLLKEDCALWRVDNQNLLQKFMPRIDLVGNKLIYKSSSTYSGWCEQISNQYFRVSVRVIKQNRSETSIEPEIPLTELFPAMSEESLKNPRTVHFKAENATNKSEDVIGRDNQRISVHTLLVALLDHSLTMDTLQENQKKNDWTFVRSMTEIDKANTEAITRVRDSVEFGDEINDVLKSYTRLNVLSAHYYRLIYCQICLRKKCNKILQFYDRQIYDEQTLKFNTDAEQNDGINNEEHLPTIDVFSCPKCSRACEYLHRLNHYKLHLLRLCEEKLECVGTEYLEIAPERIVEVVKNDKPWIGEIINNLCDLWKSIKSDYK